MESPQKMGKLIDLYMLSIGELTDSLYKKHSKLVSKQKKEFRQIIVKICREYKLPEKEVLQKYLDEANTNEVIEDSNDDLILDKVTINGENYYVEQKEGGRVLTTDAKEVGVVKDGKLEFHKNSC